MANVAFFTFGILQEAADHPRMQAFWDRSPHNFAVAEQSDGFIDHSRPKPDSEDYDWGEAEVRQFFREAEFGRAQLPRTLSLWKDLESVFAFAYVESHAEALSHRKEWFLKPEWPTYVAWWVPDGHTPQWSEAVEHHQHLHDHGPSPYAFDFKHPFGADGEAIELDRALIKVKIERNALQGHGTESEKG
jgi:Domain of unknown function (DUF3291)